MDMKYAEETLQNGFVFFHRRHPSEWVHFQTPNTHIQAYLYAGVLPPPPGGWVTPTLSKPYIPPERKPIGIRALHWSREPNASI